MPSTRAEVVHMADGRSDPMLEWLERSIDMLEKTNTDEQVRAALQACLSDLAHGDGPEWFRALVGANLSRAVATATHEELDERWLPAMRQERDRLAARAESGAPPLAPPAGAGTPPVAPPNVANRPGCFGGAAILLLKAILRLP